jgi:chromosome partitioning protein
MRTIAVVNRKGGSGKTTTAVSVAAALADRGLRTLLIDLDPQASASLWLAEPTRHHALSDTFIGAREPEKLAAATTVPGLDIMPASTFLLTAEQTMKGNLGVAVMRALQRLKHHWAFVIVDCPPSLSYLSVGALMGSREVIIPVEAHAIAMPGVAAVVAEMRRLQATLNPSLWDPVIVACRVNRTLHSREMVEQLGRLYGDLFANVTIRDSIRLPEAADAHMPITTYAPESGVCLDYRQLTEQLVERDYLHQVEPRRESRWRHFFRRSAHFEPLERKAI